MTPAPPPPADDDEAEEASRHDWEHAKENAAPLEFGRSTKSLSRRAFGTSAAETSAAEERTRKYERLVRRSERAAEWMQREARALVERSAAADGGGGNGDPDRELTEDEARGLRSRLASELGYDPSTPDREAIDHDPMRYWVQYIKHVRETYPSDSQRQFLLMERCARTFTSRPFVAPQYQNDVRFVRTCILYADKTSNPSEVFKMMSRIKVGTRVSLFWVAWAWVAEKAQDFAFTEKIFRKALSVGAEPRKFLEDRQRQFLRRMSRHWLNASRANDDGDDEEGEDGRGRGALNSLSEEGFARNDRAAAGGGGGLGSRRGQQQPQQRSSQRQQQQGNSGGGGKGASVGFSIFSDENGSGPRDDDALNDENDADGGGRRRRLERESERTKENNMRAERWNERGYGLARDASASGAGGYDGPVVDSIVGTSAFGGGRPPTHPPGGAGLLHQRSGSSAAFEVFVDEEFDTKDDEEESAKKANGDGRGVVDQRSLRQRLDGGTADRLTRDPLRYMKHPSKLESDQMKYERPLADGGAAAAAADDGRPEAKASGSDGRAKKQEPRVSSTDASSRKTEAKEEVKAGHGGFDKALLKEEGSGRECCFEERRLLARCYRLVSPDDDFNLLRREDSRLGDSQMDTEESMNVDESMEDHDVDMDESQDVVVFASNKPMKSVLKSSLRTRNGASPAADEEVTGTVNPRRVLFGANTNVVYTNESVNTSTASSQFNGSFVQTEETINTKLANAEISMMFSSPNANASMSGTPGNKSLLASSFHQPIFSTGRKKSTIDDAGGLSFAIHDENNPSEQPTGGGLNFSIYQEDPDESADQSVVKPKPSARDQSKPGPGGLSNFSIYQEDTVEDVGLSYSKTNGLSFAIHDENKQEDGAGKEFAIFQDEPERTADKRPAVAPKHAAEDTASISLIGNVLDGLGEDKSPPSSSGFGIYADPEPSTKKTSSSRPPRRAGRGQATKVVAPAEDTADLSLINGVMGSLENCSVTTDPPRQESSSGFSIYSDENSGPPLAKANFKIFADDEPEPSKLTKASKGLGFEIFSDESSESSQKKPRVNEPCFGDLSRIEDEVTSNFAMDDHKSDALDYEPQHRMDMESAMRKCMVAASKSRKKSDIFDLRKKAMPRALLRKTFHAGTRIDLLGGESVTIQNELGRGVYGLVLLCSDEEGQSDALKIQAPIGSLAHEYSLLSRLEDRVDADATSGFYPFPRSLALYAFAEGGLFSMTAASESGMNLIDVVNTFKRNVPELVALYYTSRMLKHLEILHKDGKVLHADVKPDNWVLTSTSKEKKLAGAGAIGGADLMLVDFGRSIDLENVAPRGTDPLQTQFNGRVAAEDMECGSMREGRSWGVDLDFFGLAASAFILLFGSHIEVKQDRTSRKWCLSKRLRRYWQVNLWEDLFDTLLNFDSSSDRYCLSELRVAFDGYIQRKDKEIASLLNQLYTDLPKKRQ